MKLIATIENGFRQVPVVVAGLGRTLSGARLIAARFLSRKKAGEVMGAVPGRAAVAALRVYRALVSPLIVALFGPACRFQPSCSEYASTAIAEHGLIRGGAMALGRLARCHPAGAYGFDPVPRATARKE